MKTPINKVRGFMLALGLLFLTFLVYRIGVRELWRELTFLGWGIIPIILSEGVAEFFHAISWRYCLSDSHRSISLLRLFRVSIAGYAINYLTPTASLGGDVAKVSLLAVQPRDPEAVSAVIVGKLSFALAHLLFVFLGSLLIMRQIPLPREISAALLIGSIGLAFGTIAFLLIQKHGKLGTLIRWLINRNPGNKLFRRLASQINQVDEALKVFYRDRPWGLAVAVLWHLPGYAVGIFQTWYFLYIMTDSASFLLAARACLLGTWFDLLAFFIPMNLGVLEGTRILAFNSIGYTSALGMTYGVAFRLVQLFWATFGLVNFGLLTSRVAPPHRQCLLTDNANGKDREPPSCDVYGRNI